MRIIAGHLGGRQFSSPKSRRTHPMSDRVRGGLFNTLGDISGLSILDAFAGSGALGFEALSRGAERVIMIDNDRLAQASITQNLRSLKFGARAKLIKASASAWLTTTDVMFDIVLLDPPYDEPQLTLLAQLAERVNIGGLAVISQPPKLEAPLDERFAKITEKDYGDAQLAFYRRIS